MKTDVWKLKKEKLSKTNLYLYSNFIRKKFDIDAKYNFNKIWKWSVEKPQIFWRSIWDFTNVKGKPGSIIYKKSKTFHKNKFFPKAKLKCRKSFELAAIKRNKKR